MVFLLAACQSSGLRSDHQTAADIADPVHMQEHLRSGGQFVLSTRERIALPGVETLVVYLEGDGAAWLSRSSASPDPTPTNPVALRLAAIDTATNVAWIARPCQYTQPEKNPNCQVFYWTNGRFAQPVVDATNQVITEIKQLARARQIHLVGYSGGGGLALLLAARRDDVASVRTLAGNLDHRAFTRYHGVSPMDASLNPPDLAARLRSIAQLHYVGADDKIVPPVIAQSYLHELSASHCATVQLVPEVTHSRGWERLWASAFSRIPSCGR